MLVTQLWPFIICLSWPHSLVQAQGAAFSTQAPPEQRYIRLKSTNISDFLPIDLPSALPTFVSGEGFANDHVMALTATIYTDGHDPYDGRVTMQARSNGNYTLIHVSKTTLEDITLDSTTTTVVNRGGSTLATTMIICYGAASQASICTCRFTTKLESTSTWTSTTTTTSVDEEEGTSTYIQQNTMSSEATYSTQTADWILVTMSDYMSEVSMDTMIIRRPSTADESRITTAPERG